MGWNFTYSTFPALIHVNHGSMNRKLCVGLLEMFPFYTKQQTWIHNTGGVGYNDTQAEGHFIINDEKEKYNLFHLS